MRISLFSLPVESIAAILPHSEAQTHLQKVLTCQATFSQIATLPGGVAGSGVGQGTDGHSTTEGQVTAGGHVTGGGVGGHVHSGVGGQVTTGGHVTGGGVGGNVTTGGYVTGEGVGRNVTSGACLVYTALCDEPNRASCTRVLC